MPLTMQDTDYDTIIIGSGAGGLTAALALAQAGQRVLVCEQHEVPGGWMHSFTLDGYRFNTGVHYIGELGPGDRFHVLFDHLGLLEHVTFEELNPDGYDHICIGNFQFDIPKGEEAWTEKLVEQFPDEREGIRRFFRNIHRIDTALRRIIFEQYLALCKDPMVLPWLLRTGQRLIHAHVRDPILRSILLARSGNHGMPPSMVSGAVHAAIIRHYINGGYHPRGGGMALARAFVRVFKKHGGELRLSTEVTKICLSGGRACGVELENGERLTAHHVISNADPTQTFTRLIDPEVLPRSLQKRVTRSAYSTSSLSLYLVLNEDPGRWNIDSGNYWIYDDPDIDLNYRRGLDSHNTQNPPSVMFLTATSKKDPSKGARDLHQLEVFSLAGYEPFSKWADTPSGARGDDYKIFKEAIAQRMLAGLDRRFPGLSASVVWQSLGTPLSNVHYIKAHQGNMYGIAKSVNQSGPLGFPARSPVPHLYLCGASTMAHGIAHASGTGLTVAAKILGAPVISLWPEGAR